VIEQNNESGEQQEVYEFSTNMPYKSKGPQDDQDYED
jgi:hypothetical protein